MPTTRNGGKLRVERSCSFCGRSESQVDFLIPSPTGLYICDRCVDACNDIIFDHMNDTEAELLFHMTIADGWDSETFEHFRKTLRTACPDCARKDLCLGGCPLKPEIVLCDRQTKTNRQKQMEVL